MPKRKAKYQDKPHVMSREIRERFEALMKPTMLPEDESQVKRPTGELWSWDTLEDVAQDLTIKPGTG